MTYVKICGLRKAEHVETAIEAGANFIGFVFAPSKRKISLEQAVQLAAHIPSDVKKVGVFVNASIQEIREIAETVPLDYVQYHGDESNEFIEAVGTPSIKAFSITNETDFQTIAQFNVDYYLFDAPGTDYRGGSGHAFDWSLLEQANISPERIILAGGLTVQNIEQAIATVQPYAVDVSSGVERDGQKDHELIRQFIDRAKGRMQYDSN